MQQINDPDLWDHAYSKGNLTMSQGRKFGRIIFKGKRGYKPCDDRIVQSRKTKNEIMDLILPLTETQGGGGHEVDIQQFFSLALPTYYNRLKTRLHSDKELTPEEESEILSAITEWNISFDARSRFVCALTYCAHLSHNTNVTNKHRSIISTSVGAT